jgi:hypothetical protein
MQTIITNVGGARALLDYTGQVIRVGVGNLSPWVSTDPTISELTPPRPSPTTTVISDVVGFKRPVALAPVIQSPNGNYVVDGVGYAAVPYSQVLLQGVSSLYIRVEIFPGDFSVADGTTFRSIGVYVGGQLNSGKLNSSTLLSTDFQLDSNGNPILGVLDMVTYTTPFNMPLSVAGNRLVLELIRRF